jgi:preprotein translocase subunit YajC
MEFLLTAAKPGGPGGPASLILTVLPWLIFIFLFYYLFVSSPMKKKQKEFQNLMSNLKTGDRIVTNGGMYGVITGIQERTFKVRIANNVVVEMDKTAISGLAPDEKEEKK